jgi:hypothetical protein
MMTGTSTAAAGTAADTAADTAAAAPKAVRRSHTPRRKGRRWSIFPQHKQILLFILLLLLLLLLLLVLVLVLVPPSAPTAKGQRMEHRHGQTA